MKIIYAIDVFRKDTEEYVGTQIITNLTVQKAKEILSIDESSEYMGDHEIKEEHVKALTEFTGDIFELYKYDYFIGAVRVEE